MRRSFVAFATSCLFFLCGEFAQLIASPPWYTVATAVGNDHFVTASSDNRLTLWDGHDGTIVREISRNCTPIRGVTALGSRYVVALTVYGQVIVWDLEKNKKTNDFWDPDNTILAVAGINSTQFVSLAINGKVFLWSVRNNGKIRQLDQRPRSMTGRPRRLEYMGLGIFATLTGVNRAVDLWDAYSGETFTTLEIGAGTIGGIGRLDTDHVVAAGVGPNVDFWSLRTGTIVLSKRDSKPVNDLAVLDSNGFVTIHDDSIRIWREGEDYTLP